MTTDPFVNAVGVAVFVACLAVVGGLFVAGFLGRNGARYRDRTGASRSAERRA